MPLDPQRGENVLKDKVKIINSLGLHVRPAVKIKEVAEKYKDLLIKLKKDDIVVDANRVLDMLTLGAYKGTELEIIVEGDPEMAKKAIKELKELIEIRKFDEE